MWAIKKKLNLNKKDAGTPTAKLDIAGTLITIKEGLLQVIIKHIKKNNIF